MFIHPDKALHQTRHYLYPYLFLLPALLVLLSILIYPLLYCFKMSFHSYSLARGLRFIGLRNYVEIMHDPVFWKSLKVTLIFSLFAVSIELLLGLFLAIMLNRKLWGRNVIRGLFLLSMLVSPIVSGIMWRFMYNADFGIINYFFEVMGFSPQVWTGDPSTALLSCIIVDIWQYTPFVMLLLLAGLQSIPKDLYEAARVDGATSGEQFKYITLAMLKPMILVVLLMRTMDSFKVFDMIYALTGGGPGTSSLTTSIYAYYTGFRSFHLGYASAISWIMALITLMICLIYIRSIEVPSVD